MTIAVEKPKRLFANVQAGRGLAAILVVLYHADKFYFGNPTYWSTTVFDHLFKFGHSGVAFFFVLSGFIIYNAHQKDIGRPDTVPAFLKKRITRIYPFYWIVLAATIALLFAVPGVGAAKNRELGNIMGSILLAGINPLDATVFVSWTLFHEMVFYALFILLLLSRKVGIAVLAAWWAACLAVAVIIDSAPYPLAPINLLFGMGLGTALILARDIRVNGALLAIVGALMFLATGIDDAFLHALLETPQILSYGIASAIALAGLVTMERQGVSAWGWLAFSGDASYAIYLTHMLGLGFGAKALRIVHAPAWMPAPIGFALLSALGIAGGIVAHRFVEKPLLDLMRRQPKQAAVA